jgi:hypothetical protein
MHFVLIFALGASASPLDAQAPAEEEPACFPACSPGYICHDAKCIQACNPLCDEGYRCSAVRTCVVDAPAPAKPAAETATLDGQVCLYRARTFIGWDLTYSVRVDTQDFATLSNGSYACGAVREGEHLLVAQADAGPLSLSKRFTATAGETVHLRVRFSEPPRIEEISSYESELIKMRRVRNAL